MVTLALIDINVYTLNLIIEFIIFVGLLLFSICGLGLTLFRANYLFLLICFEAFTLVSVLLLLNISTLFKDLLIQTFLLMLFCLNATEISIVLSILVLFFNLSNTNSVITSEKGRRVSFLENV